MIEEEALNLIDKFGVSVVAFVMMFALYVQNQRWNQKHQEKSESRFDIMVNNFTKVVKEITDGHDLALQRQAAAIEKNTVCVAENTAKLSEHIRQKDEFMEFIKDERRTKAGG